MKTKLLVFVMFLIGLTSFSQNTYVPDDNFEQFLIDSGYDSGPLDDYVPTANINTIVFLEIQFLPISDLTGIEDFTALEILRCNYLQITSLDISQNTSLTWLDCIDNQLTSLDISQNTALTTLDCQLNQLTNLDVSQNILLTSLTCNDNNITSLDVSQNTELVNLYCGFNELTSLDLSHNTDLVSLSCSNNELTTLDLSQNTLLNILFCDNNQLASLDLSQNKNLPFLYCYNNNLSNLDVSLNTELRTLNCSDNQITSLDLSQNTLLAHLISENNDLNSLNIKNGNNTIISTNYFRTTGNPNLTCINVDDVTYSTINWTNIDAQHYFSEDCSALAIDDYELDGFKLFPNPVNNEVNISINEEATYVIFNINGHFLMEGKLKTGDNHLNISKLSDGLYLLKIRTEKGFIGKKFIKM